MFKHFFRLSLVMLLSLQATPASAMYSRSGSDQGHSWWSWRSFMAGAAITSVAAWLWSKKSAPKLLHEDEIRSILDQRLPHFVHRGERQEIDMAIGLEVNDPRRYIIERVGAHNQQCIPQILNSPLFLEQDREYQALCNVAAFVCTKSSGRSEELGPDHFPTTLEQLGAISRKPFNHMERGLSALHNGNIVDAVGHFTQAKDNSNLRQRMVLIPLVKRLQE